MTNQEEKIVEIHIETIYHKEEAEEENKSNSVGLFAIIIGAIGAFFALIFGLSSTTEETSDNDEDIETLLRKSQEESNKETEEFKKQIKKRMQSDHNELITIKNQILKDLNEQWNFLHPDDPLSGHINDPNQDKGPDQI